MTDLRKRSRLVDALALDIDPGPEELRLAAAQDLTLPFFRACRAYLEAESARHFGVRPGGVVGPVCKGVDVRQGAIGRGAGGGMGDGAGGRLGRREPPAQGTNASLRGQLGTHTAVTDLSRRRRT
ncbi:hypothetical protein ACIP10_17655 [Streptomyces galbus]|uniref:hypothetical protein n=1 Tax=Streptomyces galbus TaxID=33898 RepID=UPI00378CC189